MNRRSFLRSLTAGTVAAAFPALTQLACENGKPPNILFIFADDQAFDALNHLSDREIDTPHLDRLVKNGVMFSHTYNQGAWHGAVCIASRTMLNTGRFLWHAHQAESELQKGEYREKLWSQYMKEAGYETYMSGKWHVMGVKPKDVFDVVRDVRPGMPADTPEGYNRPVKGEPDPWSPWDKSYGGYWEGGTHWSTVLGNHGVSFLEQASQKESPFFMYLAFNAPHDPRQSPKKFVDKYPLEEIEVPENYLPEYPYKEAIGCGPDLRDEMLAPFPRTEYAVKVHRQEYYAIISHMDQQIGRILDALEASGKEKNTYIFFTADHGLSVGHHGLMGKQNMFDHSVRAPLIVCGPGIKSNRVIDTPVYLQDIMPTTLELAGVSVPEHVQFKSLLPVLKGKRDRQYDAIYGAYMNLQRMVTRDHFKLVYYPEIDKTLLFDLESDPKEMNNLAEKPEYAEKIAELKKALKDAQQQTGDSLKIK